MRSGVVFTFTIFILFFICTYSSAVPDNLIKPNKYFDFFDKNFTFSVSLLIDVGLIGLKDVPNLIFESSNFQHQLEAYKSSHKPSCIETGNPIPNAQYYIRYRVQNFPILPIKIVEDIIYTEIVKKLQNGGTYSSGIITIPATNLENTLEETCIKAWGMDKQSSIERGSVLVIAPLFSKVLARFDQPPPELIGYQWSYNGGPGSNTFIGRQKIVFIDVGASKSFFGPISQEEGAQTPLSVPSIPTLTSPSRVVPFESQLASVVFSAVTHVYATDINFIQQADSYDKILIPIITFANHNERVDYDFDHVWNQIDDMFPESTSIHVVRGHHNLHEHKHISIALSKSIRTKTHYDYVNGKFKLVGKEYIDSKDLIYELKNSLDSLAKGLLTSNVELNQIFFPSKSGASTAQGLQILPIYIFSLHDMNGILLEDYSVVQSTHEAAIVLHSNHDKVKIPYYIGNREITISLDDPTRHILAGLAMAQGVVSPTVIYSRNHDRLISNYLWATGHHPFGHYSNTSSVSIIHKETIVRNIVLSRIAKAVSHIQSALSIIENFANTYMHGRLTEEGDYISIFDEFYEGDEVENPLAYTGAVDRLKENIDTLKYQFSTVTDKLRYYEHGEAYELSKGFIFSAKNFHNYVESEIHQARIALLCCNIKHIPSVNVGYYGAISIFLTGFSILMTVVFLFGYLLFRQKKQTPEKKTKNILN